MEGNSGRGKNPEAGGNDGIKKKGARGKGTGSRSNLLPK